MNEIFLRRLFAAGLAVFVTAAAAVYPDRPPPAHTGGFGEPTCRQCHFDAALNEPGGALAVTGLPERYAPGETYDLTVILARPEMERGGFQFAARHADGTQAGRFAGGEGVVVDTAGGVEYVRHADAGPAPDSVQWRFGWTAPGAGGGPVTFHAAGNAANGDASEFGDFVYTWEAVSRSR